MHANPDPLTQKIYQSPSSSMRPSAEDYEIHMAATSCKPSKVEKARGADAGDAFQVNGLTIGER
jgi:hypothetical protein